MILEPPKIKSDVVSTVSPSISHEVMGPDAMIFVFNRIVYSNENGKHATISKTWMTFRSDIELKKQMQKSTTCIISL